MTNIQKAIDILFKNGFSALLRYNWEIKFSDIYNPYRDLIHIYIVKGFLPSS